MQVPYTLLMLCKLPQFALSVYAFPEDTSESSLLLAGDCAVQSIAV